MSSSGSEGNPARRLVTFVAILQPEATSPGHGISTDSLYEDDGPHLAARRKHCATATHWSSGNWTGPDGTLRHPVNTVHDLTEHGIGLKVPTGQGAAIDTTTASVKLVFGIFAALAEFERELMSEPTIAGLASARARGRKGGRRCKKTTAKVQLALASVGKSGKSAAAGA